MLTLEAIPVLEGDSKIDGFHLMWDPYFKGHLPLSGYSIWRRKSPDKRNKPVCCIIDGNNLASLHESFFLLITGSDPKFEKITFRSMHSSYPDWPSSSSRMFAYDIYFTSPVFNVEIAVRLFHHSGVFIYAVAFRGERVVRSKFVADSAVVSFEEAVDKVSFYLPARAAWIRICYTNPEYGKLEEWQLIKEDLSLPFAGFTNGVHTVEEEFAVFKSRLNNDLALSFENFENISLLVRKVFKFVRSMLLPATSVLEFMQPDNSNQLSSMNAAPFAMLQSFAVYHNWRMGLGFGYLDQHELVENFAYDYKITAKYHKNCLESIDDFHTVPIHTRVGPLFALSGIFFYVDWRTETESFPTNAISGSGTFVKGIQLQWTHIFFPDAVDHLALYCINNPAATITIVSEGTTLPVTERVEIVLTSPKDNLLLQGNFILTGIAFKSLEAGTNPRDVVDLEGYSFHHVYKNTERLLPPSTLTSRNNQSLWVPNEKKPPEPMGFILKWLPPPAAADAIDPSQWPPDSPEPPPPGELGYYKLEYRDESLSSTEPWKLYDEHTVVDPTGIILPGDDYSAPSQSVTYGVDLLDIFPTRKLAGGTFTSYQRFRHYLENRAGHFTGIPGHNYRYRIWSVDLAGRNSITPKESNAEMLQKKQPPPPPAGLEEENINPIPDSGYALPDPRTDLRPQHVYARVIQSTRPNLTQQEIDLLDGRDHITVLTWTWDEDQRKLDPYVAEFRVYIRTNEHGLIQANFPGTASPSGMDWNIGVNLSGGVFPNEFTGHYVILQGNYFRIRSHGGGLDIIMTVSPPRTASGAVPQAGQFQIVRKPRGEEFRPFNWNQRIAVVPISNNEVYQYVLENGTIVGSTTDVGMQDISYEINQTGQITRCWLGVSAADNQPYVNDQLTHVTEFSPRVGNESPIAIAPVQAKFYGRPVFTPPDPLEDVPVLLLDEVNSDRLLFVTTPIEWMPFLDSNDQLRIERITGSDLLALLHVGSSIQLSDAEHPAILHNWPLNPADEEVLRAVFRSANKPVPAKFIWAIAMKNELHLDALWKLVSPYPVKSTNTIKDYLPNTSERFIYRARLVNAIGIPSESAAFFPNVWRTPDKTVPPRVALQTLRLTETGTAVSLQPLITLDASLSTVVKGILVFAGAFPAANNITDEELSGAALLKIPNRPDFLSEEVYRLRIKNLMIEPVFISLDDAEKVVNGDTVTISWNAVNLNFPFEHTVAVWAAAISHDNMLSPLGPFRKQFTGLTPPAFPALLLEMNSGEIQLSFVATVTTGVLYRLEQSHGEDEQTFAPVTGWFVAREGSNTTKFSIPSATTSWRLKIRNQANREYAGNTVQFNS